MNFQIISVIFIFANCYSKALPIKEFYIEDYCNENYEVLSSEYLSPVRLLLTRTNPIKFNSSYCSLTFKIVENDILKINGFLGQLVLLEHKSEEMRFYFNSSLTENKRFSEVVFAKKLIISVETNKTFSNNILNNNLMQTTLEFTAIKTEDSDECSDSNDPKCMNTEEEIEESSGEVDSSTNFESLCESNGCKEEPEMDCEDEDKDCNSIANGVRLVRNEEHKPYEPSVGLISETSGTHKTHSNYLTFIPIIYSLVIWFAIKLHIKT